MIATDYGIEVNRKVAKVMTPVRVDPRVVEQINHLGSRFDFTLSEYIRTAIDEKLQRDMEKLKAKALYA
jgi:hypothetical protein